MPKETFFNLNSDKQEKILRAAVHEFLTLGFEGGKIGNIAKSAGVAKGSMYQYFENKKELFMHTVHWGVNILFTKYGGGALNEGNIFDYFYRTSRQMVQQLKDERELALFIQDVFLGKHSMADESMKVMMKAADDYTLKLIREGKKNGSIRPDMDDNILAMFMIGATAKIKEYVLNRAKAEGMDVVDQGIEKFESDISAMLELLKNGMGAK